VRQSASSDVKQSYRPATEYTVDGFVASIAGLTLLIGFAAAVAVAPIATVTALVGAATTAAFQILTSTPR